MAAVAAHNLAFDVIHSAAFHLESPVDRHARKDRSSQVQSVAGSTPGGIDFKIIPVPVLVQPAAVIDRMKAMGPLGGKRRSLQSVAGRAGDQCPGKSLQLFGCDIVVGIRVGVGPDGMRAAVAAFAADTAVAFAVAEQCGAVFRKALVDS